MEDIKSLTIEELTDLLTDMGEKPFRARQIYSWMHNKLVSSYDGMTNLPKSLRERLSEYPLTVLETCAVQVSSLDGTRKYLFRLPDGNVIESVLMRYQHGNSVCISSQAGCRMGCRFCASGIGGLVRSLTASEMLDQVYRIQEETGERVSNVVVMGTGEPLDNYDSLLRFIRILTSEEGLMISQRNITVSTCGLVPKIYDLAEEKLAITLAISLHAPNDEKRRELMPIAGVNDREEEAKELAARLKGLNCHVNLIPVNPVKERSYQRSLRQEVDKFKNILEKCGINVTIRREMGADIDGACGQLRRRYLEDGSVLQTESEKQNEGIFGY